RPVLDALGEGGPARGCRYGVRRHARGLRRPRRRDEGTGGGAARPPLDRVLAPDAGLRVQPGRAGRLEGRGPSARPDDPAIVAALALSGLLRLSDHRLAGARGTATPAT